MPRRIELSDEEIALLLQALEDAVTYRDARSHVVQSAVRRRERRVGGSTGTGPDVGAPHRERARAYEALALRLRGLKTMIDG